MRVPARTRPPAGSAVAVLLPALLLLSLAAPPPAGAQGRPVQVIEAPVRSFGTAREGEVVRHDFVVRNRGDQPLILRRVVPGCGCTTSAPGPIEIPPGGSGVVPVSFDTGGFAGKEEKPVRVFGNDPDAPTFTLTLAGEVIPDLRVEPPRLSWKDVIAGGDGTPRSARVRVSSPLGEGPPRVEVKSFSPSVTVGPVSVEEGAAAFTVTLADDLPVGEFRDRVAVFLAGRPGRTYNVPVFALVKGPFEAKPAKVDFGFFEDDRPVRRIVRLDNLAARPVEIRSVESSDPSVSAEVKAVEPGRRYEVTLVADPVKVSEGVRGVVTLRTSDETAPESTVRFVGVRRPRYPTR